ncbi:dihydrolipoamide acetyltransferase family protein [Capnocytophaga gingivalis]|jgi:lipoamide acyltransferase component of branched-chain alpha-keto aciddehydrogenase complex|uniref:dihydrolipoamide acetyltransferase family protein n=1 Tax=Capnocytophaga gingivalis TaxID=1017 RepID=UPI0028D19E3D|nr:dihydrolipoamide acetyltransferase family protein [Capnocytophaga gingivalis]
MARYELKLPQMGESVEEATVSSWLKKVGDTIHLDDILVEVATDKVDSEIPSDVEGILTEILTPERTVVKVGQLMAVIETIEQNAASEPTIALPEATPSSEELLPIEEPEQENISSPEEPQEIALPAATSEEELQEVVPAVPYVPTQVDTSADATSQEDTQKDFYSPLVRTIAKEENISEEELASIEGTGAQGRITKYDILRYLENRTRQEGEQAQVAVTPEPATITPASSTPEALPVAQEEKEAAPEQKVAESHEVKYPDIDDFIKNLAATQSQKEAPAAQATPAASLQIPVSAPEQAPLATTSYTPSPVDDNVEVIEMTRMGKLIANYMSESKHISAHATSFIEVDVTRIWNWRNKYKKQFESREGEKLTFTPIFIEAVAKALKDFPLMNISTDGERIFRKKNINIGMATALPNGDLIVPVIKNADQLSLVGLAKSVNDLAKRARENKLKPEEVKGGTYTVTNIGAFGNLFGTPILNQPEVGILAIGAIQKVPAVVETPEGDVIAIRYKLMLSHSFDHRVVNGALGGMFVQRVAKYLEQWDITREV